MQNNHVTSKGFIVPVTTPFNEKGGVDAVALIEQCKFVRDKGASGIFLMGTTGEFPYLEERERKHATETVKKALGGSIRIIVHVGAGRDEDVLALARHAEQIGADAIAAVTPYFYTLDSEEIRRFFSMLLSTVGQTPVLIYNIAVNAKNFVEPQGFAELAQEFANLQGAKNTTASLTWFQQFVELGEKWDFYIGNDELILPALSTGAWGSVSSNAIVFPEPFARLFEAYNAADWDAATDWQRKVNQLTRLLQQPRSLSRIKKSLTLRGIPGCHVRKPMLEIDREAEAHLLNELRSLAEEMGVSLKA